MRVGEVSACAPTEVHADTAVQETPASVASEPGTGVSRRCHVVPFQDSARVKSVGFLGVPSSPTAMQLVLLVQETELSSSPPPGSVGEGLGVTVHAVPFRLTCGGGGGRPRRHQRHQVQPAGGKSPSRATAAATRSSVAVSATLTWPLPVGP